MSKENIASDERAEMRVLLGKINAGRKVLQGDETGETFISVEAALDAMLSLRPKPVAGVEVKPLEWQEFHSDDDVLFMYSAGAGVRYEVFHMASDVETMGIQVVRFERHPTYSEEGDDAEAHTIIGYGRNIEAAYAIAQTDYRQRILSTLSLPAQEPAHPDDLAVDRFAAEMKAKLAKKRTEGRGGWDRKDECTVEFLSQLLREHVEKGDPVDVGNLAMMIQQRGERITK